MSYLPTFLYRYTGQMQINKSNEFLHIFLTFVHKARQIKI